MCDTNLLSLFSDDTVAPDFIGPLQPGVQRAGLGEFTPGELLGEFGGALAPLGEAAQFSDLASQRKARAGQILKTTQRSLDLKDLDQQIARGRTVRAIGRSGVKKTGSAARLLDRQDMLDELALEAAKQRGVLQIAAEKSEIDQAKIKRNARLTRGLARGFDLLDKGFDLG